MKNTIVSGEFRNTVTYAVPSHRSGGSGEIRSTATMVPISRAPTADRMQSWRVSQKPLANRSRFSNRTLMGAYPLRTRLSHPPLLSLRTDSVPLDGGHRGQLG